MGSKRSKQKTTPKDQAPASHENDEAPPGGWFRENLEAIVIAVIMALVIRHFCVEAFKIPTSSMEPTLYGNHPADGIHGDRILVNKFVYRFSEPERWDVIVFKYPLDKTKNFIKRLIGLPGEELKIWGGNILVKKGEKDGDPVFEVARKPQDVQDAIWQEIYPMPRTENPGHWVADEDSTFQEDGSGGVIRPGKKNEAWIQYRGFIHARRSEATPVGELKTSVLATAGQGEVRLSLDLGEAVLLFKVPVGASGTSEVELDGKTVASAAYALPPSRQTRLDFVHVDGTLELRARGKTVFRHEMDPPPYSFEMRPVLRIGIAGGGALSLSRITIHRDIHYTEDPRGIFRERTSVKIPQDAFLVLGDNCTSSKDSRLWKQIVLRTKAGEEVVGEYDSEYGESFVRRDSTGEIRMLDVNGNARVFHRNDLENFDASWEYAPFVPRKNLIGQAFMIFYPIKRIRLIR